MSTTCHIIKLVDGIDFNKFVATLPERKESEDPNKKGNKIVYYVTPFFYNLGNKSVDILVRLPIYNFYPINESSYSMALIHDPENEHYDKVIEFFDDLKAFAKRATFQNAKNIGQPRMKESEAVVKDPIHFTTTADGRTKGHGRTYFKFIRGSPIRPSTRFIGPDLKSYPLKKFYGFSITGSPVIRIEGLHHGQSNILKISLFQIDIHRIKRLDNSTADPNYGVREEEAALFLQELEAEESNFSSSLSSPAPNDSRMSEFLEGKSAEE